MAGTLEILTGPKPLILARGKVSNKFINHEGFGTGLVTPVTAAIKHRGIETIVIGAEFKDETRAAGMFNGELGNRKLIEGWRAMHIIEDIAIVDQVVFEVAQHAVKRYLPEEVEMKAEECLSVLTGKERYKALRTSVLGRGPLPHELEDMLENLEMAGIGVNGDELIDEINRGHVTPTPLVEMFIEMDEDHQWEMARREAEIAEPIKEEKSIAALFTDLGIKDFVITDPGDPACIEKLHISPELLEEGLRRRSYETMEPFPLLQEKKGATVQKRDLSPGIQATLEVFDDAEYPSATTSSGFKLTFKSAVFNEFKDGEFRIMTDITDSKGYRDSAGLRVPELRDMLSDTIKARQQLPK